MKKATVVKIYGVPSLGFAGSCGLGKVIAEIQQAISKVTGEEQADIWVLFPRDRYEEDLGSCVLVEIGATTNAPSTSPNRDQIETEVVAIAEKHFGVAVLAA